MADLAYGYMNWPGIEAVVYGEESSPKDVMGPRIVADGILLQGFFPGADHAYVLSGRRSYEMTMEDEKGYFAVVIPGRKIPRYRFRVVRGTEISEIQDAYRFNGWITETEEKAFCAGIYYEAWKKLGAHLTEIDGVSGCYFAVWAPNAQRVSVVGSFDEWNGLAFPMHRMPMSGIFELFVPGLEAGQEYLYEIRTGSGEILLKADPYARRTMTGSRTALACMVPPEDTFEWEDEEWMEYRLRYQDKKQPVSICEINLREWKTPQELVDYISSQGYTHVELTPVMDCLDRNSEGYSTAAYFSVTDMDAWGKDPVKALKSLIQTLHLINVGVILDWTPAQFPRFEQGLERYDGTVLYERQDPASMVHPVWGTLLFNYGSPMVRDFLLSNACFWLEDFHADGLRLDDVDAMLYLDFGRAAGDWTPNIYGSNENLEALEFIKHLNSILHRREKGILIIAQEDGLWPQLTEDVEDDHPGFDYKWSGGWTRDFLTYLSNDPVIRKNVHDTLTLSMLYAYCEHYVLTLGRRDIRTPAAFMEGFPVPGDKKAAQLREAVTYMFMHPGCKMLCGAAHPSQSWTRFMKDLNELYTEHPALYQLDSSFDGFEWIQLTKADENVLAFLRMSEDPVETLLVVFNFAAVVYETYDVGVPFKGKYKEIFNTDRTVYGGSGCVNQKIKVSRAVECDEREQSVRIRLGALSAAVFSCTKD